MTTKTRKSDIQSSKHLSENKRLRSTNPSINLRAYNSKWKFGDAKIETINSRKKFKFCNRHSRPRVRIKNEKQTKYLTLKLKAEAFRFYNSKTTP